jgi:hypothetical protein
MGVENWKNYDSKGCCETGRAQAGGQERWKTATKVTAGQQRLLAVVENLNFPGPTALSGFGARLKN